MAIRMDDRPQAREYRHLLEAGKGRKQILSWSLWEDRGPVDQGVALSLLTLNHGPMWLLTVVGMVLGLGCG